MWFITNWKIVSITILAIALIVLSSYAMSLRRDVKDAETALELANANYSQCQADIRKRDEISRDNHDKLTDLNKRLNAERLRRSQAKCIPIKRSAGTASKVS